MPTVNIVCPKNRRNSFNLVPFHEEIEEEESPTTHKVDFDEMSRKFLIVQERESMRTNSHADPFEMTESRGTSINLVESRPSTR